MLMVIGQTNISTYRILQINVKFFAVQQSIDHIHMSSIWSMMQCRKLKLR